MPKIDKVIYGVKNLKHIDLCGNVLKKLVLPNQDFDYVDF